MAIYVIKLVNYENDKIRLPRPMGVTQLMFEYKQTQDPAIIEKIISYCIQQWIIAMVDYVVRVIPS